MKKLIQLRMHTDAHGFPKRGLANSFFFPSVSICVHPWLKKYLLVCLALGFWLLTAASASAQIAPADDFFHSGAQNYITNNIAQAKQIVEQGRKLYPDDEKLKKLEELLNQQNQQQQQQNQQQQKQQDQSQQQKSDDQNKPDQQPQPKDSEDQKKQDEQKKSEEEQKKQAEQKKPEDQKKDGEKKDEEAQPVKAGEMTPEEAKRLLDSQKGNEQLLQLKPQEKPRKTNRPIKDW